MNITVTKELLIEWFGDDIFRSPTKRKRRRTKKEMLESHRITCTNCGNSWTLVRG